MPDTLVSIPLVGQVAFPEGMSEDDITAASKKLHLEAQQTQAAQRPDPQADYLPEIGAHTRSIGGGAVEGLATGGVSMGQAPLNLAAGALDGLHRTDEPIPQSRARHRATMDRVMEHDKYAEQGRDLSYERAYRQIGLEEQQKQLRVNAWARDLGTWLKAGSQELQKDKEQIRQSGLVSEDYADTYAVNVSRAAGTSVTSIIVALATRGQGMATYTPAGLQIYQEAFDQAVAQGADFETANQAGLASMPAALLEKFGDVKIANGITKSFADAAAQLKDKVGANALAKKIAMERGQEALGEAATEAGQSAWQNTVLNSLGLQSKEAGQIAREAWHDAKVGAGAALAFGAPGSVQEIRQWQKPAPLVAPAAVNNELPVAAQPEPDLTSTPESTSAVADALAEIEAVPAEERTPGDDALQQLLQQRLTELEPNERSTKNEQPETEVASTPIPADPVERHREAGPAEDVRPRPLRSEASQRARRAARERDAGRPWDLIDEIEASIGSTIDPALIRQANPDWKPEGGAKEIFRSSGQPADVALAALAETGKLQSELQLDEFGELINQAARIRQEQRKSNKTQEKIYQDLTMTETEQAITEAYPETNIDHSTSGENIPFSLDDPGFQSARDNVSSSTGIEIVPVESVAGGLAESTATAFRAFEEAFGKRIRRFREQGGTTYINGFVDPAHPKTLWINADSRRTPFTVLGHELVESMLLTDPGTTEQFFNQMEPLLRDAEGYQARLNEIERRAGILEPSNLISAKKELIADFTGNRLSDPGFWDQLQAQDPNLFERVATLLSELLDKIINLIRERRFPVDQHIKDLQRAQEIVAAALTRHARSESSGEASGRPQFSLEGSQAGNEGTRQFGGRLDEADDVATEIKEAVENRAYIKRTNESDAEYAARLIEQAGGALSAAQDFNHITDPISGSERMIVGQLIVKQLSEQGRHEAAAAFLDETFMPLTTDIAQALQSLKVWFELSPEGKIIQAKRKITRRREGIIGPHRAELEEGRQKLNELNEQGIAEAAGSQPVQTAAGQVLDQTLAQQARQPGELNRQLTTEAINTLEKEGYLSAAEAQVLADHLSGREPGSLADKLKRAGSKKTAAQVNQRLAAEQDRLVKRIRQRLIRLRKWAAQNPGAVPNNQLDNLLWDMLKAQRVKLAELVRQHYTQTDQTAEQLDQSLQEAGFHGPLEHLRKALASRFKQAVKAEKEKQLRRLLKPLKQRKIAKPGLAQKLLELSNLGALDEEQYWAALADRLKLPTWTPELAQQVKKQVEDLHGIPEDQVERRQKAYTHFLRLLEREKGIDLLELGIGFFVTNVLTGPTTHLANMISTYNNALAAFSAESINALRQGHASDILLMAEGAARGVKKAKESAQDVFGSGIVTGSRSQKAEAGVLFEQLKFGHKDGVPLRGQSYASRIAQRILESWPARVLNLWKYNYRLMGMEDMMAFKPAEEVKAARLAAELSRTQGLKGEAARDAARQILGYGADQWAQAHAQAASEGLQGSPAKRRAAELLETLRPAELKEDARHYALRTTFNNDPYGALGWIAQWVNRGKRNEDPRIRGAFAFIAPFTNIVANVTNESINYSPAGFWRARAGREHIYGFSRQDLSPQQWRNLQAELQAKAFLGTMAWTTLGLIAASFLDDEDPEFAVYANGPGAGGDRAGWLAAGGRPWSVKVGDRTFGYAHTPLQIPLGFLGAIMDKRRDAVIYRSKAAQRDQETLPSIFATGVLSMGRVITEQSFLQGMADLFGMFSGSRGSGVRKFESFAARSASATVIPNALKQLDKAFDPKSYRAEDLEGILTQQVPWLRRTDKPSLNALGLPVEWGVFDRFTKGKSEDPVVLALARKGVFPSMPDRHTTYKKTGGTMTEDDFYNYVAKTGKAIHQELQGYTAMIDRLPQDQAEQLVRGIVQKHCTGWKKRNGYQ